MKAKRPLIFMFYLMSAMMLFQSTCYAYIDPATTSYIIQIAAAALIACGTILGICWNKFTRLFRKNKKADNAVADNTASFNSTLKSDGKDIVTADDLMDDDD